MDSLAYLSDQFSPRNASVNWDPAADLPEEGVAFFDEYNKIPLFLRFGMGKEEIKEQIFLLAQKMGWEKDLGKVGEISRLTREIFIRGLRENEILSRIKEKLGLIDQPRRDLYQGIKRIARLIDSVGRREFDLEFERQAIIKLLGDYPEIRVQKITQFPLQIDESQRPYSSSVENWLRDYVLKTGSQKHSTLERGRYLFESENAKRLNSTERENLAILLKSYDEGVPLVFDRNEKKILLEESRKIDDAWLASLRLFLGEEEILESRTQPTKSNFPVFREKNNRPPARDLSRAGLKNVLDLSDLV